MRSTDRQCEGKHKHQSKGKAEAHVRNLVESEGADADQVHAYHCDLCGSWHVGRSKKATVERAKRRRQRGH